MSFAMLFATRFKDITALEVFQSLRSDTVRKTGLEQVANRQFLNRCKTIKEAPPLDGRLVESSYSAQGSAIRIHTEAEPYGMTVAVEYKGYGLQPSLDEEIQQNLVKVKENIRTLATILQNSAFIQNDGSTTTNNELVLHILQCIGYIDEPRGIYFFQLSTMASTVSFGNLQTLQSFIEEIDSRKRPANYMHPPPEQRFFFLPTAFV